MSDIHLEQEITSVACISLVKEWLKKMFKKKKGEMLGVLTFLVTGSEYLTQPNLLRKSVSNCIRYFRDDTQSADIVYAERHCVAEHCNAKHSSSTYSMIWSCLLKMCGNIFPLLTKMYTITCKITMYFDAGV